MRFTTRWMAALLLPLLSWSAAQVTVGVDPIAKLFTANPGQSITQILNIYNPNKVATKIRVIGSLSDMNMSEIGQISYLPAGTVKESLAGWTTFSPSEVLLGSEDTAQVRYTIQVPADAAPGTHWAMLMFEAQDPNPTPGQALAAMRMRVAHTVYVNVAPTKKSGEISGIFENVPSVPNATYDLGVQYNNTGNVATGVQGRVEIRDATGALVANLSIPLEVSLPGRSLFLKTSWGGPVPKGQYSALIVLNDGDKTRDLTGEQVINLPFDLLPYQPLPAAGAPAPARTTDAATTTPTGRP
ncbi:hypothetical protein [Deinococcus petrolearius]|uniref:P pilus assembly protein, chaperone PapD n=1 Tax=Deinococcus petrolearius TaxID=1751295 RepID=A0ABW1DFM1_9DEIO